MGLALFALSALSQPIHTLAQWLHPRRCTPAHSPAHAARTPGVRHEGLSSCAVASIVPEVAGSASGSTGCQPAARMHSASCATTGPGAASRRGTRRPVRVLHPASRSEVGRMVISGRMADVCAELERMAACETCH